MKIAKIISELLLTLFGIIFALWLILFCTLQTKSGREWLFHQVTQYLEKATQTDVLVETFQFTFPCDLKLENIVFLQENKPLITIGTLDLRCNYSSLLQGKLKFSYLLADHIHLLKLPKFSQSKEKGYFSFREYSFLPFYLKFEQLDIKNLTVNPDLFDSFNFPIKIKESILNQTFNIKGELSNNPFKSILTTHLYLTKENYSKNEAPFKLEIDILNNQLSLLFEIDPLLSLKGTIEINQDKTIHHSHFEGKINDISYFSSFTAIPVIPVEANIGFEGNLSGSISSPKINLKLNSSDLTIYDQQLKHLHARIQLKIDHGSYNGLFSGSFDHQNIKWKSDSSFDLTEKKFTLFDLEIEGLGIVLKGDLSTSLSDYRWEGQLIGEVDQLTTLSHYLSIPFTGKGKLKLHITKNDHLNEKFQGIEGEFVGEAFQWKDWHAEQCRFNFSAENFFHLNEGKGDFSFKKLHHFNTQLEEVKGSTLFRADQSNCPFQLTVTGENKENLSLFLDGTWEKREESLKLQINHLTGDLATRSLLLKYPLLIDYRKEKIELNQLSFEWGGVELQGEFHQNKEEISAQFKTNGVPLEYFHFMAPQFPATGNAFFQGNINGTFDQPKGKLEIDLEQVQLIEELFAKKTAVDGKLYINFDQEGVLLQSQLRGVGNTPFEIKGTLPFHFQLQPFRLKNDRTLPFYLTIHAEGEIDRFLHLFYHDTTNASGRASIAVSLEGEVTHPEIKGTLKLTNGSYESLSTGTLYHNIQAVFEGNGSNLLLKTLSAEDNKNGQITATGTIELNAAKSFPFEFEITPSHIYILDSDYIDISASGQLNLSGTTQGAILKGELNVDQATVHLEETLPQKIKNIDIAYINVSKEDPILSHIEKTKERYPLELNVKLNALRSVQIEGSHLKSDWKGSLLATGTIENIQLNGDLRIEQGEYQLQGKEFNLKQGNIHFAGPPGKKTSLYVVASKEINRITAEIILKGPVTKPLISFRSTPPLSQREVLSYILFGQGISDITKDQGDQLSQSFITLNSTNQTKKWDTFLSRLRNNIGIDHLEFTTNDRTESKDFGVKVSKQITDNLTVTVNQSMVSLSPVIAVEAKLRKNLKVQAEGGVGQDAPIRMSIKWKKDY